MINKSDSLPGNEGSHCATIVLERLIRGGIQTHPFVRDNVRDAGVADAADHATGHDLPVAAGGACHDDGANGIVRAMVRTNWDFGKTTINILMISVIWNGVGVQFIWTLLASAGNSNTKARTELLDRLRKMFPDLKIASLMGDREFIGDSWMADVRAKKIPFILRLRENQHGVREGYATWTIVDIARRLNKGQKMIVKCGCRLGQNAGHRSPLVRLVVMLFRRANFWRSLALPNHSARRPAIARGGRSKPCSPI